MSFWSSREGEKLRSRNRYWSALRLALEMDPLSKGARRGTRAKAKEAIRAQISEATTSRWGPGKWPRPRAHVALDVAIYPSNGSPPRIDNTCKWLLDELGGPNAEALVYADDRQVKLLFAAQHERAQMPDASEFWGAAEIAPTAREPVMYVTAQTMTHVRGDLRRAQELETPWEPLHDYPNPMIKRPEASDLHIDFLEDYRRCLDPQGSAFDQEQHASVGRQIEYERQGQVVRRVDELISLVVSRLLTDDRGAWNWLLHHMRQNPYVFDLGVLPGRGASATFEPTVRNVLQQRRAAHPHLFPLRTQVGLSVVYFEAGAGKDLDNLLRSVLPAVLETLEPPATEALWRASSPSAGIGVQFVEAMAVSKPVDGVPAGSVFIALSGGWRRSSWWEQAGDYVYAEDDR